MSFTVIWLPDAEEELAALWLDAQYRNAVTRASEALERRLQSRAPECGESRPNGRRVDFEWPLGVLYRVDEARRTATVSHVWLYQ
jgi:hypothetical protein